MRKHHKASRDTTPNELDELADTLPNLAQRFPWETSEEYKRFHHFLFCPGLRSVRKAYRNYCEALGETPRQDPPPNWYQLYKGEYVAFRRAKEQLLAIEHAGEAHQRFPNWDRLKAAALHQGVIGQRSDKIGQIADDLVLIQWAFWSLSRKATPSPACPPGTNARPYTGIWWMRARPRPWRQTPSVCGLSRSVCRA